MVVHEVAPHVIPGGTWAIVMQPGVLVGYVVDRAAECRVRRIVARWRSGAERPFLLDALDEGELVITDSPTGILLRE